VAAQRGVIHAKRTEQADVAPLFQVGADSITFVDSDRHSERNGVQRRLQSDGAGAEDGNAGVFAFRHRALLASFRHCTCCSRPESALAFVLWPPREVELPMSLLCLIGQASPAGHGPVVRCRWRDHPQRRPIFSEDAWPKTSSTAPSRTSTSAPSDTLTT